MQTIVECFPLPGSRMVIVLNESLKMPVKTDLVISVRQPDGSTRTFTGRAEFLQRRDMAHEIEAFMLRDATPEDVMAGASVDVALPV